MGVFAYKAKGKFPSNFVMEAVDVYLVAKGVSAEVGYKVTADLMADLDDAGLLEEGVYRGLIHSHHNMATNFSGTDYEQLKLACQSNPYYLSVVVNNVLDFTAKVAIESKEVLNGYSYFKTPNNKEVKTPKTYTKNSYEIIEVDIECQWPEYMLQTDAQIKDIQNYSPASSYHNSSAGYSHNQGWKSQQRNSWELFPESYYQPSSVPASKPAEKPKDIEVLTLEEEEYELCSQHLAIVIESLKLQNLKYKEFADALLETCSEVGIPVEIMWEYIVTEEMVNDKFDNQVVEYLEPIVYKEDNK
jgi:hypothetical protein